MTHNKKSSNEEGNGVSATCQKAFWDMVTHETFPRVKKLKGNITITHAKEEGAVQFFIPGEKRQQIPEIHIHGDVPQRNLKILFNGKPWNDIPKKEQALRKVINGYRSQVKKITPVNGGGEIPNIVLEEGETIPNPENVMATIPLGDVFEMRAVKVQETVMKCCVKNRKQISTNWYCETVHKKKDRTYIILSFEHEKDRIIRGRVYFYDNRLPIFIGPDGEKASDLLKEQMMTSLESEIMRKIPVT